MGVHDVDKYPEVKRLLGIPEDEPIFILRAQDILAADAIERYGSLYLDEAKQRNVTLTTEQRKFRSHLLDCEDEIFEWQDKNADKVKLPD